MSRRTNASDALSEGGFEPLRKTQANSGVAV
jgi:hypothetical protein